jgi:CPA2 family monovalent cation:H+ antiporter-2
MPAGKLIERQLARVGMRDSANAPEGEQRQRRRDHVIVIGFGPAGKGVMRALKPTGTRIIVVELNPRGIAEAHAEGLETFLGDASQEEVLEHLDIHDARAVVITIPDHNAALAIVRAVRQCAPKVQIIARSRYHLHAPKYLEAGAHVVLDEEEHVGAVLGERLVSTMTPRSMSGILRLPAFESPEDNEPIPLSSTVGPPGGDHQP